MGMKACTMILFVFMAIALSIPCSTFAGNSIPDLKGAWEGTFLSIKYHPESGHEMEHRPAGHSGKMLAIKFNLTVDYQEKRVFAGTIASAKHKESVTGVIALDNETLYLTDQDSTFFGKVLGSDRIELIWTAVETPAHGAGHGVFVKNK
jgi:hypothetical protein